MKNLIQKGLPTKKYDFLGVKNALTIRKLSGREMKEFQKFTRERAKGEEGEFQSDEDFLAVQFYLIKLAVAEAADLEDTDLEEFPLEDISKLSEEILAYSGVNVGGSAKN